MLSFMIDCMVWYLCGYHIGDYPNTTFEYMVVSSGSQPLSSVRKLSLFIVSKVAPALW